MGCGWRGHHLCILGIMLISYGFITSVETFCGSDHVQPNLLRKQHIDYMKQEDGRSKRAITDLLYQPIRITVSYHDLDEELDSTQQNQLKTALAKTLQKVQNLFSVQRIGGPLVLSRSNEACYIVYQSGANAGKCADVRESYRGEICIDDFLIPDNHLEGLEVYDETSPEPIKIVKAKGAGVDNTDFILYVRSLSTDMCIHSTLPTIAYASHCHLDQNNRPLAGYINFCPVLLNKDSYNEDKLYFTALHELFHALGFSNKLYEKFRKCDGQNSCYDRRNPVQTIMGEERLVTPKVVELTSKHFGCTSHEAVNKFGPILQTKNGQKKVYSHWDGAFMFSSIMTPKLGLPEETLVDAITLALFEDTGWYKVDYSQADYFPWGEAGGCYWGRHPQCIDNEMDEDCFCTMREKKGCHYLYIGKGVCNTDTFLHGCFVYQSTPQDSCTEPLNSPSSILLSETGEMYAENSRCFVANLTSSVHMLNKMHTTDSMTLEGRCYDTRCNGTTLEVKVGDSPWLLCPDEESIGVPGYEGVLHCPHTQILCRPTPTTSKPTVIIATQPNNNILSSTFLTTVLTNSTITTTTVPFTTEGTLSVICIDIVFTSLGFDYLVATNQEIVFKEACLYKTMQVTGVARRRINNILVISGSVIFKFDLLPAQYAGDGPSTNNAINILRSMIHIGNFSINLSPEGATYTASKLNQMEGGPTISLDQTPTGVIAGVVIGSVIAALIIGTAVYFVQRYYTIHSQNNQPVSRRPIDTPTSQRSSQQTNRSTITSVSTDGNGTVNTRSVIEDPQNVFSQEQINISNVSYTAALQNMEVPDVVVMTQSSERTNVLLGNADYREGKHKNHQNLARSLSHRTPEFRNSLHRPVSEGERYISSQTTRLSRASSFNHNPVSVNLSAVASPQMLRNSTEQCVVRQSSRKKPCALKCKCVWLKEKLKGSATNVNNEIVSPINQQRNEYNCSPFSRTPPNEISSNFTSPSMKKKLKFDEGYSSPSSLHLQEYYTGSDSLESYMNYPPSYQNDDLVLPRYPVSVIQCSNSPIAVKRDFNSNFYPHFVSLEDIKACVDDYQSNPAPSVNISNNSAEDTKHCSNIMKMSQSPTVLGTSESGLSCRAFPFSQDDIKEDNRNNVYMGPRISHRSSCNSFVDSDYQPTYTANIEFPFSEAIKKQNVTSTSDSVNDSGGDKTSKQFCYSDNKEAESGVESAVASDVDVSFLANNVELSGNRFSTSSWHSFSSDTSLDSSVVHIKQ